MLTSGSKPSPPSFPLAALAAAMALACGVLPLAVHASPRAAFDDLLAASSPAIVDVSARLNPTTTATSQLAPVFDSHPGLHLGLSTPAHLSYDPPRLPRPPAFRFGGRLHASHALTHHLALRPTPLPPLLSHAFSTYDLTHTLSRPDHHNPIPDPTLFAYDPTHLLPQPSRAPLGPIDSPNLYQAFGLDPMNVTDPLGLCGWWSDTPCVEELARAAEKVRGSVAASFERNKRTVERTIEYHGRVAEKVAVQLKGAYGLIWQTIHDQIAHDATLAGSLPSALYMRFNCKRGTPEWKDANRTIGEAVVTGLTYYIAGEVARGRTDTTRAARPPRPSSSHLGSEIVEGPGIPNEASSFKPTAGRHADFHGPWRPDDRALNWGEYLVDTTQSAPPAGMYRPHGHHVLFRRGFGRVQQAYVKEGQEILKRRAGIDPIWDTDALTWAPNAKGVHSTESLRGIVDRLKALDAANGTPDQFRALLRQLGEEAAQR